MNTQPHKERFVLQRKIVKEQLCKSSIRFKENFRVFPLGSGTRTVDYVPHFYLNDIKYGTKRVLLEVNTGIKLDDVTKFRLFLDIYGRLYHLILVVDDLQIRNWNQYDDGAQAVFHDIWPIDSTQFLMRHLASLHAHDLGLKKKN